MADLKESPRQTKLRRLAVKFLRRRGEMVTEEAERVLVAFGLDVWTTCRQQTKRELQPRKWYLRPTQVKAIRRAGH